MHYYWKYVLCPTEYLSTTCTFWPIDAHSGQKQPDNFDEILLPKA